MSLLQNSNAVTTSAGYDIENSVRYNIADSPALTKTFGTPTNALIWTYSVWVKRGSNYGAYNYVFGSKPPAVPPANATHVGFKNDDTLQMFFWDVTDTAYSIVSSAKYRDSAAWYHLVFQFNTPHATSSERMKMWVNGTQVTALGTSSYPPQNTVGGWNNDTYLGIVGGTVNNQNVPNYEYFFDGLMAEVHFVDGQALTPSNFGELDEDTNQWKAKKYTGTYGNNGFFLEFQNSAALGTDTSGNGNNYASANLAATDQMIDTPQNSTGGNFPTWNPLCYSPNSNFYEGNLKHYGNATASGNTACTFTPPATGKWYWEEHCSNIDSTQWPFIGTVDSTVYEIVGTWSNNDGRPGESESNGGWKISADGEYETDGGGTTAGGVSFNDTTDIIQFALDHDNGALYYGKNNVWYTPTATTGDPTSGASRTGAVMTWTAGTRSFIPAAQQYNSSALILNCGQDSSFAGNVTAQGNTDGNDCGDFYYTPPTGYLALCSNNLAEPTIPIPDTDFSVDLYTGTGAAKSITGVGFQPELVWIKNRESASISHALFDAARGVTDYLRSDTSAAEVTDAQSLKTFDSDGFTLGTAAIINTNTDNHVSWNWEMGSAVSGATTSSGTAKTYEGYANPTAGQSVIKYVGNGTNWHSVPHGLSKAPEFAIIRKYGGGAVEQWTCIAWNFTTTIYYKVGALDATTMETNGGAGGMTNSAPDATNVNYGGDDYVNSNGVDMISYLWHSVDGFSKCGMWSGNNNANGPFVYTGFRPAFILFHRFDAADNWNMYDKDRGYNSALEQLRADTQAAEFAAAATNCDLLSNGFKFYTNDPGSNAAGKYFYLALAESPFKTSRAR